MRNKYHPKRAHAATFSYSEAFLCDKTPGRREITPHDNLIVRSPGPAGGQVASASAASRSSEAWSISVVVVRARKSRIAGVSGGSPVQS